MIDFTIRVAGKVIGFKSDSASLVYDASREREFKKFVCEGQQKTDILFDIRYGSIPVFGGKETLFGGDGSWSLSRCGGKILFEYPDRSVEGRMERVAQINADMTEGVIYVNREKTPEEEEEATRKRLSRMTDEQKQIVEGRRKRKSEGQAARMHRRKSDQSTPEKLGPRVMYQIKENFFQAFLVEYLIRKQIGFLVHCSSVKDEEKLHLFMGQTRAGKSTMAEFWHNTGNAKVFNDDRAIIAVRDGAPCFHNAPWAGDFGDRCELASGDGTRIETIYFISHNSSNKLRRLDALEAATKIFSNSFPVFWQKSGLDYVREVCSEIAGLIPCYDLGFTNNEGVVGFLKDELKQEAK